MCGIVAEFDPAEPCDEAVLRAGLSAIRHRGPDGEGVWRSPDRRAGLGHVRLAILDLAGSPQPIASEDGQMVVVVNGEFYDHGRLRADLGRRGHRFRTGGDGEVAVHLYEEYGTAFVDHLRGEFALVLWDGRARRLVAARDRFGIKPLCFHREGSRLRVASEAKALFAMGVPASWDEGTVHQVASMQYPLPDRTLFAEVRQLRPGHLLVADAVGVHISPYWDMDYPPEEAKPPGVDVRELAERLAEAVLLRLRADVPVAFHLSGGLDSSSVVALAARLTGRPPPCFTVGFDRGGYDELDAARRTAEALGAELHPVVLPTQSLLDHLGDAVWFSEGLAINGHLPAKYLLAREIRRSGYPVVLSGEGADEILAGYAHFRQDLWRDDPARCGQLAGANEMVAGMHLPEGQTLSLDSVRAALGRAPTFLEAKASLGWRMRSLLRDEFRERFADRDPFGAFLASFPADQLQGRGVVDQASYLWSKSSLATYILRTLGDGTEMAHAVEGRLPFLDHKFFEFVRDIPTGWKVRGGVEKWALRQAMVGLLPEEVLSRPKQPFTAPPLALSDSALLHDTLFSAGLASSPFFDPTNVRQALAALPSLPERERLAWDPVFMLVLTACLAQGRFGL